MIITVFRTFLISLLPWGTGVILALQSWSHPALEWFFIGVTLLGTEGSYLLLLPVFLWCLDKRLGLRVAVLVLLSVYLNEALKALFRSPRPDPEVVRWVVSASGWGFPSGHAQTTTVLCGFLALWFRPRRWTAALWAVPPLVSLSRLYLGVHYPQDVVGGMLIGLAVLALSRWATAGPRLRAWGRLRGWQQAGMLALAAAGGAAPGISSHAVAAMGALLGIGCGALWERHAVRYAPQASVGRQALKLLVGLALMALPYGLGKLLLPGAPPFQFLRYAILGGLATGVVPWLFLRWCWCTSTERDYSHA